MESLAFFFNKKLFYITLICLFLSAPGFSQPFIKKVSNDLFLYNYTVKDGLSESIVNTIYKDSRGIAWIGTDGGLNKFNTYSFEVFKEDTSRYSISHSRIYDVTEDEFGNIWIGTANGLNKYLPEVNGFEQKIKTQHDLVEKIIYDPHRKSLWLAMVNQGLVEYHIPTNRFKRQEILSPNVFVHSVLQISRDSVIVGTQEHGIFLMNLENGDYVQISQDNSPIGISSNRIRAMAIAGKYLFAGTDTGLNIIDFEKNEAKVFSKRNENFSSDLIVCIEVDKEGFIWVGTDGGGLYQIDPGDLSMINYVKESSDENSLKTNVIKDIYADENHNIWLGTNKYGFGIYNKKTSFINNINLSTVENLHLKSTSTTAFCLNNKQEIFLGTDGGGLLKWDGRRFEKVSLDPDCKNCYEEKVLCLIGDEGGNLWIGTYADGLYCLKKDGTVLHFEKGEKETSLNSNNIWDMRRDHEGNLWLATDAGLTKLTIDNYQFKAFLPYIETDPMAGRELRSVLIDKKGMIWTGSFSGLYCFDPQNQKFVKNYTTETPGTSLISNVIITMYQDDADNIWLGTYGKGIQVLNPYREKVLYESLTQSIGNKMVLFIHGDNNGNIWAGTNSGIVTITPQDSNFFWFNTNNGLQDDEYNMNAVRMVNDSILIAGGTKGFVLLNTKQLAMQQTTENLILERVSYENQFLPFNPYKNPDQTPEFKIDYSKSGLNLSFAALDYTNSQSIRYSYILENFDKDWSHPDKLRQANYTNLPPGSYYFKVKTTDLSQSNNNAKTLAKIVVYPAWWMTTWFRVIVAIFFIGLVLAITKARNSRLKKSESKLLKAVSEKTQKIERQKLEIEQKKFEIELRNNELMEQNMELQSMNEELNAQKETISDQRERLEKAHGELQKINSELEEIVKDRTGELNNTINELNKTISELDRFVYSASHDLGAPLKSILGLINIAKLETRDDKIMPHLDFMNESVHKLENVIQSLIQYSRNSRLELHPVEIPIAGLVCDCYDTLKFMPGYENIHFENEINRSKIVISDENRLRIIIRNLLSNAIKYSDPDKREKWVQVKYEDISESRWQLIVSDNGLGIHSSHLEKIFHMFYRANESSDGSGLGLYITKEAITKLHGEINVRSEVNKGTEISVILNKYH